MMCAYAYALTVVQDRADERVELKAAGCMKVSRAENSSIVGDHGRELILTSNRQKQGRWRVGEGGPRRGVACSYNVRQATISRHRR